MEGIVCGGIRPTGQGVASLELDEVCPLDDVGGLGLGNLDRYARGGCRECGQEKV